ncbi:DUF2690 domain-containing protein [Nocardia sp. BMG111209]|uniref:DUF2690 domain-containing protein n=1 Tax=Nocardia sp. BMG111209 TaxID=1160137 RepID=UPI0018C9EC69|nr:DUF2690 domain-containing protein [Nocardia sp. BMG111209]
MFRHWKWAAIVLAVLIATNTVTVFVTKGIVHGDSQHARPIIATGSNPLGTECLKDVVTANSVRPPGGAFELKLLYSTLCDAVWAKVARADNAGFGNRITVTVFQFSDPQGKTRQFADEFNVDSAYTMVIVRHDPTDRLCATGSVTNGSAEIKVDTPICM